MKCGTCNATFQDNGSLEIHYQYTHSGDHRRSKEFAGSNSNSIGNSQPSSHESSSNPDVADSTETNNNRFYKFVSDEHLSSSSSGATVRILQSDSNGSANAAIMTTISPGIVHSSSSGSSNELGHVRNEQFLPQQPVAVRDLIGSPYDLNSLSNSGGVGATILNNSNSLGYDSNYALTANDFARCSPHLIQYSSDDHQRYHPYYKPSLQQQQAFARNQFPPSSLPSPSPSLQQAPQQHQQQLNLPLRCDKCDFICFSQEILLHHLNSMHHGSAFTHFGYRYRSGVEPSQAEILDLDSHKVHVYQPPVPAAQDQRSSSSSAAAALDSWMQDSAEKKFYPTHHQNGNNGVSAGPAVPSSMVHSSNGTSAVSGVTPLPSPDFGNVSTTTDNIDSLHSSLNSPFRSVSQFDHHQVAGAQIGTTSTGNNSLDGSHLHNNNAGPAKKSSTANKSSGAVGANNGGGGGGSWKSNEPRRPKTYNCSACNKWFTSSGHLKRHYNTTLHKNAVKQSGAPDPATMPISAHHHPHKDPSYVPPSSRQMKSSPPGAVESSASSSSDRLCAVTTQAGLKANDAGRCYSTAPARSTPNQFYAGTSNVIAPVAAAAPTGGATASDISGGLVHPHPTYGVPGGAGQPCNTLTQTDLIKCPSPISQTPTSASLLHPNHSNYHHLSFAGAGAMSQPPTAIPLFQQPPTQSTFYPNFQSPHVSTIRPVTTITNPFGNDLRDGAQFDSSSSSLPSFSCIQRNYGNQHEESADNGGNGGSSVVNKLWNYTQYFGLEQLIGTLHNNGNVGGRTTESRHIDSSLDNDEANQQQQQQQHDENTPPSGLTQVALDDEDEMASEEEVYYTELFNGRRFSVPGPDLVSGFFGQCRVSAFHHVPDSKVGFISPKQEDSSMYDDENTTVSSSTIDSVNQPLPSSLSDDSTNSGGSVTTRKMDGSDVGQFQCAKCQKGFNKACYLTQHNKSFHSGFKPYKCLRCGKRYTDTKQFNDHIDKHAGDKPHKCEICPKQFNHKTDLRRHVCLHTNVRPHTCDLCQKGFIRKDHMLKHRETHANRKQILRHTRIPKLRKQLELQVRI